VRYLEDLTPNRALADTQTVDALSLELLQRQTLKPTILHGPDIGTPGRRQGLFGWLGDSISRGILETPTNKLVRHPYANTIYTEVYKSLRERVVASGKELDRATLQGIENEAHRIARRRVAQIMFDFSRTGRLDEMMWFVTPFLQPFMEMLTVWPARILKKNPAIVGYINRLGHAAAESGFIRHDESTGQDVIPMSGFMAAAPIFNHMIGGNDGEMPGWMLNTPAASFNMFLGSTFPVNILGTDVPIPTPSLSPQAQGLLQHFMRDAPIDEDNKARIMAWLTQYGEIDFTNPVSFIAPTWAERWLQAAVPSWFENETNRNVNHMLQMNQAIAQQAGIDWEVNEQELEKARWQAKEFSFLRGFTAMFFPGAPIISPPTRELKEEWDTLLEAHDFDKGAALSEFAGVWNPETGKYEGGRHPGMTMFATGTSMWNDTDNPFPMPANINAERILQSEGGKQFAKDNPRWVFFIIPDEIRQGEFDWGVWNQQIARAERIIRTPEEFDVAEQEQESWRAFFYVKEQFDAWKAKNPELGPDDLAYEQMSNWYKDMKETIAEEFPEGPSFKEFEITTGVNSNVLIEMRKLLATDEFVTKTDLGRGLKAYFDGRDAIRREMKASNINNLDTKEAARLGYAGEYADLVRTTKEAHPDFAIVYDMYLEHDLQDTLTNRDKFVNNLTPEEADKVREWESEYNKLEDLAYSGKKLTMSERFEMYDDMRVMVNTAFQEGGLNVPRQRYKGMSDVEKADFARALSTRDPLTYSRLDWWVLGVNQNDHQANFFQNISERRSRLFARDKEVADFSLGAALDEVDQDVLRMAKRNPAVRKQLKYMNDWAWRLEQVIFGRIQGLNKNPLVTDATREDWHDVIDSVREVQAYANKREMVGTGDWDEANKIDYIYVRDELFPAYIKEKKQGNQWFARQWDQLSRDFGLDFVIGTLIPENNYPLGKVDY
jgi:hypothetical protein